MSGATLASSAYPWPLPGDSVFTTPGTYTFTVPGNVTSISAVLIGGGGGVDIYGEGASGAAGIQLSGSQGGGGVRAAPVAYQLQV